MTIAAKKLSDAHARYQSQLARFKKLKDLFEENKHRSKPNRGPYEYGLRVAYEELQEARTALDYTIRSIRKNQEIKKLRKDLYRQAGLLKPMQLDATWN